MERIGGGTVRRIPLARFAVQGDDGRPICGCGLQPASQQIGKQVMIAIPLADFVQGHDEEIGTLKSEQDHVALFLSGDSVTQGGRKPLQHRGFQQEILDFDRLSLKDFIHQIIENVAIIAGEGLQEPVNVAIVLHRERRKLQSGNPSFGAGVECRDVVGGEGDLHHTLGKVARLFFRKPQIGLANIRHLAACAQS